MVFHNDGKEKYQSYSVYEFNYPEIMTGYGPTFEAAKERFNENLLSYIEDLKLIVSGNCPEVTTSPGAIPEPEESRKAFDVKLFNYIEELKGIEGSIKAFNPLPIMK